MSVLRKFLIALTIFLFLVFLVAFILPRVIDLDKYKPTLISMVEERINGKVNIRHIELTILDGLGARLHEFEVLNADRFGNSPFLRVRQLDVKIKLLPLLAGKINSKLILEAPQIFLEKNKEGIFNFKELIREPTSKAEPSPSSEAPSWIDRFSISALRIKGGKITYINHSSHSPERKALPLEDLDLKMEDFLLDESIPFELALKMFPGREQSLRLKGMVRVDLDHRLFLNEVGVSVPWLAQDVEGLNGELKFSSNAIIARNLSLKLGNSDINLDFELSNFENPKVSFELNSNRLDLDELLPESLAKKAVGGEGGIPETEKGEDLLKRFTAQGKVKVTRGKVKRLSFENLLLTLSLRKKLLTLSNISFNLYGGSYQGTAKLDIGEQETTYIFQSQLREVKVNELLSQFPSLEGLFSGFLSAELSLSGKGVGFESFGKSLSGAGKVSLSRGRISFLSLEKSLSVLSKLEGWESSSTSTNFQVLEGQVSICASKVNTSDLRLNTSDLTITASGYFNQNRQVDYQAQAVLSRRLSQSLEGSSGGEFFKDEGERIVIPFRIEGTIDNPEFSLDREVLEEGQKEWALRKTEAELNKVINKELNK